MYKTELMALHLVLVLEFQVGLVGTILLVKKELLMYSMMAHKF
jgi:hypothetical protein